MDYKDTPLHGKFEFSIFSPEDFTPQRIVGYRLEVTEDRFSPSGDKGNMWTKKERALFKKDGEEDWYEGNVTLGIFKTDESDLVITPMIFMEGELKKVDIEDYPEIEVQP